ncbi:MAG: iron ABC transporter permease [Thermomicrobiales bacterium]|nr:MAG: iron ABC transporter permease [Thermomicrobiales bacterium]
MTTMVLTPSTSRAGHRTVRRGGIAVRVNLRVLLYTCIMLGLLGLLFVWAMTLGSYHIPFVEVAKATVGYGTDDQLLVVRELRLPRVLTAALVGASLAVSGAIFQGLVRNPLVSPDIIGVNAGATVIAVFWIVSGLAYRMMPLAAFAGASFAAAAVYLLTWKKGIAPNRLILVGIGVGEFLIAITQYLLVKYPLEQVRPAIVWSIGSVYGSNWFDVKVLAGTLAVCMPLAVLLAWPMRAMQLGDDVVRGLGLQLERTRLGLLVIGCALAGVAVALAGPIAFVALMVPHFARMLAGPLSGTMILFTAAIGAFFVLLVDVIGQHFLPVALPVGALTAAFGAPYFLFLLYRSNTRL